PRWPATALLLLPALAGSGCRAFLEQVGVRGSSRLPHAGCRRGLDSLAGRWPGRLPGSELDPHVQPSSASPSSAEDADGARALRRRPLIAVAPVVCIAYGEQLCSHAT